MSDKDAGRARGPKSCGPVEVPTQAEKEALDALRGIKGRVREIKARLEKEGETESLERELEVLREAWEVWQKRRESAARERMVMLGHEEP
jgi:hypothetical protein